MAAELKEYHYWSDRLVAKAVTDFGISLENNWELKVSSPSIGGTIPQIEASRNVPVASRGKMAVRIKKKLRKEVGDIDQLCEPKRYVSGSSSVFYGEFPGEDPGHLSTCLVFSAAWNRLGQHVAICLFGSMHNLSSYLKEAGPVSRTGWTSSYFNEIQAFVRQRCERPIGHLDIEELAVETLKVAYAAGADERHGQEKYRPWNRSYTYGDIPIDVEWFALVHRDVDIRHTFNGDYHNFDRILIGSPLWLCSPLSVIRRYSDCPNRASNDGHTATRGARWPRFPFHRFRNAGLMDGQ